MPDLLAERVGFEPTVRETVHLISNQAHSTTLAPLLNTGRGRIVESDTLAVKRSQPTCINSGRDPFRFVGDNLSVDNG